MPVGIIRPNERETELIDTFYYKYNCRIRPLDARLLRYLMDVRLGMFDNIFDFLWPEEDGFDCNFGKRLNVHICQIRKRLGSDLVDIQNFPGVGYALTRLGPKDNPIHERKISGTS